MSLLEQKRLQWAKEKAQMRSEWNPWGRPGGGAPLSMGNTSRKALLDWNSTAKPNSISQDSTKVIGDSGRRLPPLPLTLQPFNSKDGVGHNFSTPLLFGIGTEAFLPIGKDHNEQTSNDYIIEEQEINQNEINLGGRKSLPLNNSLHLESEGRQTPGSLSPAFSIAHTLGSHTSLPALDCSETLSTNRSFLRGANIPLDPDVRAELEIKRRKQREQQLAIQAQLEEKQIRMKEEKERIKREEAKEEEKFVEMNQRLLQQQLMEEEQRIKKCSPVAPKVQLEASSNENLAQSNQVRSIPTPAVATGDSQSISCKSGLSDTNKETNKATIQIPSVITSPPYIENRLLTPTKYRGLDEYLPRECGTQTDAYLFNKKDVAIDTEKEDNRKFKTDGKSYRQKQEKEHEIKHKPKWGVHQSQKTYQRQSDKEVASRRLEEMRQKRLKEEALIQLNQPKVGNGRTRSSAKHQRYLLARETISPLSASYRNSASPNLLSHQSSTESSTYDSNTESSIRRQRRQWDSPRGDELPNFYTQPLAGRRNSRSQSSQSVGFDTPDFPNPERFARDVSPSAPVIPMWNSALDLNQHSQPIHRNRFHNSLENMRNVVNNDNKLYVKNNYVHGRRSDAWSTQSMPIDRYSLDFVPYSRNSVILEDGTTRAPFVDNRILQQLSTIRQGLLMKQKQMEHFLNAGREFSLPDKTYGT